MTDKKDPQPMDAGAPETDTPVGHAYFPRQVYAMEQLITEVTSLFPEVTYETSGENQRRESLHVKFENYVDSKDTFVALMRLVEQDKRVFRIVTDEYEDGLMVCFRFDPRTMDDRAPFGLREAYLVLEEGSFTGLSEGEFTDHTTGSF